MYGSSSTVSLLTFSIGSGDEEKKVEKIKKGQSNHDAEWNKNDKK